MAVVNDGGEPLSERRIGRAVLDALSGVPLFVTAPLLRRWHTRWGATDAEVAGPMPGDEVVPKASFNATRAITIDAPPNRVWPWIVQMGYRRAGFYTYALLDNAGYDSADRVLPDYQDPKVGDWMPMSKKVNETTAFKVESTCQHAGVNGLRGVWRKNQKVMVDMCVSPNVGLPLAVTLNDEDGSSVTAMQLVEFRP